MPAGQDLLMYADMNGYVKGGPGTRRSMPLCAILLVGLELLSKAYHQALASCMTTNDHSSQHEYHPSLASLQSLSV